MKTVIQTRVDSDVRRNAENILCAMGLSLNDGIRMFLHQLITDRAMPFRPNVGNEPNDCLKKMHNHQFLQTFLCANSHRNIFFWRLLRLTS